jgi:predicted RNase H-like HicB family nuclease
MILMTGETQMRDLKDTLMITVESYSGKEPDMEYEHPYYVAHCDDIGLVTDGDTLEELLVHLKEALSVCLEGVDTAAEYGVRPDPRILLTLELTGLYAKTA